MRSAYLAVFDFAALLAADLAWGEVVSVCVCKVFGMVTSHAMLLLLLANAEIQTIGRVSYCLIRFRFSTNTVSSDGV